MKTTKCDLCGVWYGNINVHKKKCSKNSIDELNQIKERVKQQRISIRKRCIEKKIKNASEIECSCGCGTRMKSVDNYGRNRHYVNGHGHKKYNDPTQYKREWNHRNRKQRLKYKSKYGKERKVKLLLMLGGKCVDCNREYNGKNAAGFDFHHEGDKNLFLSQTGLVNRKWSEIIEEAKKCCVLCAFCHRVRHFGGF